MSLSLWISLFLLWASALRPLHKYAPVPEIAALGYALILLGGWYAWQHHRRRVPWLQKGLSHAPLTWLMLAAMLVATWWVYPIADARKLQGKGSTADDAMIEAAQGFWENGHVYDATLYDGAPISPGPGWVLLHGPLIWLGAYVLISVLHLGVFTHLGRRHAPGGYLSANLWLIMLGSSPLFWELLVTGHDLIALSATLGSLTLLIHAVAMERRWPAGWLWAIALLVGWVATARVVFICFPLLMGLFLARHQVWRSAFIVAGVGVGVALAWHAWGYLVHDVYQPLHLFGRGERNVGSGLIGLGLIATLGTVAWATWRLPADHRSWLAALGYCLLVPLATIALGEWWAVERQFALWEGANYLLPALLPLLWVASESLSEAPDRSSST